MKIQDQISIQGENILLLGMRGLQNFGDELILLGNIKLLQKQKKHIFIASQNTQRLKQFLEKEVDCSDIIFLEELPRGLRSFFRYFFQGKYKELKYFFKIDTIILGGGEILTEETSISYYYRLSSLWPSLFFGKRLYLMGGIQIPKKRINIILFRWILKHTTHIYCRDFECETNLKEYGFQNVSFFMDTSFFVRENRTKYRLPHKEKYIVININKNGIQFLDELKKTLKKYTTLGYQCYFIPVAHGGNDTEDPKVLQERMIPPSLQHTENDLKYFPLLQEAFPKIKIYSRTNNLEDFFTFLGGAEVVISTRLHLFLISSFIGLETLVYPYQKKILKMQKVVSKLL